MNLILASKSPRRIKMLGDTGFDFTIVNSNFDESTINLRDTLTKGVGQIALGKAQTAFDDLPPVTKLDAVVLGADTIVICDGQPLLKPKDSQDAARMLRSLSGKKHTVYTAVAFVTALGKEVFIEETDVYFNDLTDEMINDYIATGEPMDKAGAYGIQGRGALLVKKIEGDYFNVVGLPISKTAQKLAEYNIKPVK